MPWFSGTGTMGTVATGASGYILQSNGTGSAPTWVSAASSSLLSSTNTWSAWQSFNNQVTISSDVYMSAGQINVKGNKLTTTGGLLDATQLTNVVPTASISGSYTNITGVGTLTAGTWNAGTVGSQWGGTGANLSAAVANGIPYFSATGVMGAVGTGATGTILAANGSGSAPAFTSSISAATTFSASGTGVYSVVASSGISVGSPIVGKLDGSANSGQLMVGWSGSAPTGYYAVYAP